MPTIENLQTKRKLVFTIGPRHLFQTGRRRRARKSRQIEARGAGPLLAAPLKSNQNITAVPIVEPKITRPSACFSDEVPTYPRPREFFATASFQNGFKKHEIPISIASARSCIFDPL